MMSIFRLEDLLIASLKMIGVASFSLLLLLISNSQRSTSADKEVHPSPREHIKGVTYETLGGVFQTYPVDRRNTDQTWQLFRTCGGLSGYREIRHAHTGRVSWNVSKPCYSVLQNCRYDESMRDNVQFCLSQDQHRRYDFMIINIDKNHRYGRDATGKCESSKFEIYFSYDLINYPCVCDCVSTERQLDRYFSLLDVVSDDDKVVTGVRFQKVDHVFYIQIQQGLLGPDRSIHGDVEWKNITSVSRSDLLSSNISRYYKIPGNNDDLLQFRKNDRVYAVTDDQRTILLNDLKARSSEAVTGLRFRQVGNDLRLEMQVTPLNRETGELDRKASQWMRNSIDKSERKEVEIQQFRLPGQHESMFISSSGYQFVRFRVSDFVTDLGQSTVPFIDTTNVTLDRPHALSGAGIFHMGSTTSAGFIAFKVFVQ